MADLLPAAGDLVMFKPEVWTDLAEVKLPKQTVADMVGVVEQDFEWCRLAGLPVFFDPDPAGGSAAVGLDSCLVHTALHDLTVTRRATDESYQVDDMLPVPRDHVVFKPDMWHRVAVTLQLQVECVPDVRGVCWALASDPDIESEIVAVQVGKKLLKCDRQFLTVTKRAIKHADNRFVLDPRQFTKGSSTSPPPNKRQKTDLTQ